MLFRSADVGRRIGRLSTLGQTRHHIGSGRVDEPLEFVEAFFCRLVGVLVESDTDDHDLLANRALNQRAPERLLVGRTQRATIVLAVLIAA